MTDEKYLFVSDSRDKKRTARGAHYRVTHGGRVKMPSDFLSKKELKKMSGECKSYRLNEPMSWAEFLELPDDLKVSYINAIRIRFGPSDCAIFKMLGVNQRKGSYEFEKLGLGRGRAAKRLEFFPENWEKWCAGIKDPGDTETEGNIYNARCIMEDDEPVEEAIPAPVVENLPTTKKRIYPMRGHMTLCGTAEEIAGAIVEMLGGGCISAELFWAVEA